MNSLLVFVFLAAFVGALEMCMSAKPPLDLPDCGRKCYGNADKSIDGTCVDNFGDLCILSGAVNIWFEENGDCVKAACGGSPSDMTMIANQWQSSCKGKPYESQLENNLQDFMPAIATKTATGEATMVSIPVSTSQPSPTTSSRKEERSASTSASAATSTGPSRTQVVSTSSTQPSTNQPTTLSMITVTSSQETTTHTTASSPSSSQTSSVPGSPAPPHAHFNTIAIAGIAIGGSIILVAVVGTAVFFLHRRRRSRASPPPDWDPSTSHHQPPTLPRVDRVQELSYSKLGMVGSDGACEKAELHNELAPIQHPAVANLRNRESEYKAPISTVSPMRSYTSHPELDSSSVVSPRPAEMPCSSTTGLATSMSTPNAKDATTRNTSDSIASPAVSELHGDGSEVGAPVSNNTFGGPLFFGNDRPAVSECPPGMPSSFFSGMQPTAQANNNAIELSGETGDRFTHAELDAGMGEQRSSRYYA